MPSMLHFFDNCTRHVILVRVGGEEAPQHLGRKGGPLVAAAVDGDEHDTAPSAHPAVVRRLGGAGLKR
jgi:hypothetical protein